MQNEMTKKLREQILALDSKLDPERAPVTKKQLLRALHNLDDYEKTGSRVLLQEALDRYNEVMHAIGNRAPERLEESEPASR